MAGYRGTSPKKVLDALGDFGSSRQPAPTSRDQPRKVNYKVQGNSPLAPALGWLWPDEFVRPLNTLAGSPKEVAQGTTRGDGKQVKSRPVKPELTGGAKSP